MKNPLSFFSPAGLLLAFALLPNALTPGLIRAASVGAEVVGWMQITCPGSSDTIVSAPLAREPVHVDSGVGEDVHAGVSGRITFSGRPFAASEFKYVAGTQPNTYYAFIASGPKEGDYFTITDNDTSSVTVALNGDTLASVAAGTTVNIVPFWTLGTLFPGGNGVTPTDAATAATQILLPNSAGVGINLGTSAVCVYSGSVGTWLKSGASGSADDTILYPDSYFTVRNNGPATTTLTVNGAVVVNKLVIPLTTSASTKQDSFVALMRASPLTLNESGLISSGAFKPSSGFITNDQIFVFDNTVVQLNKAASKIYSYSNGMWRRTGVSGDAGADAVFMPGSGVIIRKAPNAGATTSMWSSPEALSN